MDSETLSWRIKGELVRPTFPLVMGILNATPDSFHAPSRVDEHSILRTAERMLNEGAGLLDIGGQSSRPGSGPGMEAEEMDRILPLVEAVRDRFPEALISVDTWRARVAAAAVERGAAMVNDISAGSLDPAMLPTVAALKVPYVAMHMQGIPDTMQSEPSYTDVATEVTRFLSERIAVCREAGIPDVIVDPGFGFGKTTAHNYTLLRELGRIHALGVPVLVGFSRKRMVNEVLGTTPAEALNGTTVLHTLALLKGAAILRTHDVKEAVQAIALVRYASNTSELNDRGANGLRT
ncbi:MAG: dihydropteroate synthase [Flavobacteriales bacterium]|jgi:dihydropteroate synthase|nr:dihydropteroate synthase [Flavobacteriales bacterium]MBK7618790.1 dihydropteroate synthase [Flavobacteriales bacterium]